MTLVFGLEGQEGCKVAANIFHGFDCNWRLLWSEGSGTSSTIVRSSSDKELKWDLKTTETALQLSSSDGSLSSSMGDDVNEDTVTNDLTEGCT